MNPYRSPPPPPREPLWPRMLIAAIAFAASALVVGTSACVGGITAAQEQTDLAIARVACQEEAAIPVVGPVLVLACPAEIAALQVALDREVATPAPANSRLAVGPDGGPLLPEALAAPKMLVRRGTGSERPLVHAGWCPAGTLVATCEGVQRQLLAAPRPAVVLVDAGAEGGR